MQAGSDLVLGVDSGGTKTLLAIADREGSVCFALRGASLDPFAERGWPARLASMLDACAAWRADVVAAALGLPCHGEVAAVSENQITVVADLLPVPHLVLNDVRVAFDGAFLGGIGILLLAGTGSMAWAGDGARRDVRIGGWGSAFGDEGSACWIGREALSEATRAFDGRTANQPFAQALLGRLGLTTEGLLDRFLAGDNPRSALAAVARLVDDLATRGDPVATALLRRAGDLIAEHAAAARARLDLPFDAPWSFAGGVFASRTVMAQVADRLGRLPQDPRLPPVGGALLRAARLAGWSADEAWIRTLSDALAARLDAPGALCKDSVHEGVLQ